MTLKHWLATLAMATMAGAGTSVDAGLLDRLSDSSEGRSERRSDEASESFEVASRKEIGKIVTPVAYQTLAAPGGGNYAPVPETFGAPSSSPPIEIQGYPSAVPLESFPQAGPVQPVGPELYPSGPQTFPIGPDPYSMGPIGPPPGLGGYPLFRRVKVEDRRHIHPCAVPTVVQVLDPCADECASCGPRCVHVEIFAPPGRPEIKVRRQGRKVLYDYGDYKVEVQTKDGYVVVNYDD